LSDLYGINRWVDPVIQRPVRPDMLVGPRRDHQCPY
jgi:hypothetical protein